MKYIIFGPDDPVREVIHLPSSKSISNRMLIMQALGGGRIDIANLSDSDDTLHMQRALAESGPVKDIGHAGTAMRFLTAYYATQPGQVVLTGSQRMKERPVGALVDALRELGAPISYLEAEGCPPLEITGGRLRGGKLEVNGGISSQFISALMMIGPYLEGGLHLTLTGDVVSATYIEMTLGLMQEGGIRTRFDGRSIQVEEGPYDFSGMHVESDWSGASYWFMTAALMPGSRIGLPLLNEESLQGDAALTRLYAPLGVKSHFISGQLELQSASGHHPGKALFEADFTGCPDLAQTVVCSLCALGIPFRLTGTRTLRVKETDRVAALQQELAKLGFSLDSDAGGHWISWDGRRGRGQERPLIETYKDHRMAMAFAPLSARLGPLLINDPMVVSKSYPGYWDDLKKAGFGVEKA